MRRLDELTDQEVIAHLARAREPASLREIAHALELRHHGRRALQKIVSRLKRKGEIEEVHSGRFRLAGKKAAPSEARRKGHAIGLPKPATSPSTASIPRHRETRQEQIGRAHSELQSQSNLVCRLLLEKKNKIEHTPGHRPITQYD